MNTKLYQDAYAHCQVNGAANPIACSADFAVSEAELAEAPAGVDPTVWAQIEATAGCRKKVQDQTNKVSPCECKYDADDKSMHCHCYDPDSIKPPRPFRPG
jgi:hypothetical protein